MPHVGDAPSIGKNKKVRKWLILIVVVAIAITFFTIKEKNKPAEGMLQPQATTQIYPNYDFPDGVNQVKVPLIPINYRLSRQAGGWVITPAGSEFRIDYDIPVIIEYNDGRKVYRQPKQPAHDGVRLTNSIFRIYGEKGDAVITIKRGVY